MKRFSFILLWCIAAPLALLTAPAPDVLHAPGISLGGTTNVISDNGTAITRNGSPIGGNWTASGTTNATLAGVASAGGFNAPMNGTLQFGSNDNTNGNTNTVTMFLTFDGLQNNDNGIWTVLNYFGTNNFPYGGFFQLKPIAGAFSEQFSVGYGFNNYIDSTGDTTGWSDGNAGTIGMVGVGNGKGTFNLGASLEAGNFGNQSMTNVGGLGWATASGTNTAIGLVGKAVTSTGTSIGGLFTITLSSNDDPNLESSVILLDNGGSGKPLIVGRTNNGTHVFSVAASGAITSSDSYTSGAPSGGTSAAWKLGSYQTNYVEAEVGNNPTRLLTVDTNGNTTIPGTATIGTGAFNNFTATHLTVTDITDTNKLIATSPTSTALTNGYAAALTNTWGIFTGDTTKFVNGAGALATPAGGSAMVGTVSNAVASAGLLAVDATKTNGIAATAAHVGAALGTSATAGVPLISDGTATPIWFDPRQYIIAFEDFLTYAATAPIGQIGLYPRTAGSGTTSTALTAGEAGAPGIATMNLGGANSVATLQSATSGILLGGGTWDMEWRVKTPNALANDTGYYELRVGFLDSDNTSNIVDGVFFRYATNATTAGLNWQLVTRSNSVENIADSTVTVAANTWYRLRIVVNAAASAATGYVDTGSAITGNAATIPTTTGRETAIGCSAINLTYGGQKNFLADYVRVYHKLTTIR